MKDCRLRKDKLQVEKVFVTNIQQKVSVLFSRESVCSFLLKIP